MEGDPHLSFHFQRGVAVGGRGAGGAVASANWLASYGCTRPLPEMQMESSIIGEEKKYM